MCEHLTQIKKYKQEVTLYIVPECCTGNLSLQMKWILWYHFVCKWE